MEIITKTDTLLVIKAHSRFVLLGIFSLAFTGLGVLVIYLGGPVWIYLMGVVCILIGALMLWLMQWYTLTIDKQAGTVNLITRTMLRPWKPKHETTPISNVLYVKFTVLESSPVYMVGLQIWLKEKFKPLALTGIEPHFNKTSDYFKLSGAGTKDEDVAMEVANYIGVDFQGTQYKNT